MISGIAAFLIRLFTRWKSEGNVKENGGFGHGHNRLSKLLLLFRHNGNSIFITLALCIPKAFSSF